jgi:integrase/recombinase XerD
MQTMGYFVNRVNSSSSHGFTGNPREQHAVSLIYDRQGNRKYLTISERNAFLKAAATMPAEVLSFCVLLTYTGARLSEVLALTSNQIDIAAGFVIFESLKKRRRGVYRGVPLPHTLLAELGCFHRISANPKTNDLNTSRLWPWSRTTAWSRVKEIMATASVVGPQATPKGLRHGFAVAALQAGIPINLVWRWLGHARLSTTEIYAEAIGDEERATAGRFWRTF